MMSSAEMYHCVGCDARMHLDTTCTGLTPVAVNGIRELGTRVMLLCNDCVANNKRDDFVQDATIQQLKDKFTTDIIESKFIPVVNTLKPVTENTIEQIFNSKTNALTEKSTEKAEALIKKNSMKQNEKADNKKSNNFHNVSKCLRIQGIPENKDFSKNENVFHANETIKEIFEKLRVNANVENVHRLGKFSESRSKPRVTMVTLSSEWHAKLILAKSAEMWDDLKNLGFFILPTLSYEDSKKENLCLQKRRELINANVPPSSLKIRNFQLFKDDVLVNIDAKKATE